MELIFTESFFLILGTLAVACTFLTQSVKKIFNITGGFWPQFVSWILGAGLAGLAVYTSIFSVTLGEPTWLVFLSLSLCTGLVSNGIYDIPAIEKALKWLFRL